MDKKFMEFWGNALLCSVKGQQQLEDMAKWFTGSIKDIQDLNTMFSKIYGLDALPKDAPDYFALWEKSMEEFRKSFQNFFAMMDFVPRKAFLDLQEENEKLKLRIAELEKSTDMPLRSMLDEEIKLANEGVKGFQKLVTEQVQQYQELMNNLGKVFMETASVPQEQTKSRQEKKSQPKKSSTRKTGK
jgi:hypothetical protein